MALIQYLILVRTQTLPTKIQTLRSNQWSLPKASIKCLTSAAWITNSNSSLKRQKPALSQQLLLSALRSVLSKATSWITSSVAREATWVSLAKRNTSSSHKSRSHPSMVKRKTHTRISTSWIITCKTWQSTNEVVSIVPHLQRRMPQQLHLAYHIMHPVLSSERNWRQREERKGLWVQIICIEVKPQLQP